MINLFEPQELLNQNSPLGLRASSVVWCVDLPVTLITLVLVLCQQGSRDSEDRGPIWALLLWNAHRAPQGGDPHGKGLGFVFF